MSEIGGLAARNDLTYETIKNVRDFFSFNY